MNKGIIYLIQPCELVGTNKYKIGCSLKTDLSRCYKGYKKGSRYINIMECEEPLLLETKIKNVFNDKFTLIAGREFFEGNEDDIFTEFVNLVIKHRKEFSNNNEHDTTIVVSFNNDEDNEDENEDILDK